SVGATRPTEHGATTATTRRPPADSGSGRTGAAKKPRPAAQGAGARRAGTAQSRQKPPSAPPLKDRASRAETKRRRKPRPVPQAPVRTGSERSVPERTEVRPPAPRPGPGAREDA